MYAIHRILHEKVQKNNGAHQFEERKTCCDWSWTIFMESTKATHVVQDSNDNIIGNIASGELLKKAHSQ